MSIDGVYSRDQSDTQANAGNRIFGQRIEASQDAVECQSEWKDWRCLTMVGQRLTEKDS
jgi:hypothetical protein